MEHLYDISEGWPTSAGKLTYRQIEAIERAWLDLKATATASGERANSDGDSVQELEIAFPFLRTDDQETEGDE